MTVFLICTKRGRSIFICSVKSTTTGGTRKSTGFIATAKRIRQATHVSADPWRREGTNAAGDVLKKGNETYRYGGKEEQKGKSYGGSTEDAFRDPKEKKERRPLESRREKNKDLETFKSRANKNNLRA